MKNIMDWIANEARKVIAWAVRRDDVIDSMTTIIVDAPIDSSNVVHVDYEAHIKAKIIRGSN